MPHDFLDCLRNLVTPGSRREEPRVPSPGGFATEIAGGLERFAMVSDISPTGLRLHRPYRGERARTLQLELDVPGLDELIWAKGVVCFDRVWRGAEGQLLQTSGVELAGAAGRHLRLLRDWAHAAAARFGEYAERRAAARLV
ncbi:MAG TPA: PilZ domain-containing protein [Polyangia bacterium]|nr:PilZ domain-containing protein [Polyangia bacterium]